MATITSVKNVPGDLHEQLKQVVTTFSAPELAEKALELRSRVAVERLDVDEIDAVINQGRE